MNSTLNPSALAYACTQHATLDPLVEIRERLKGCNIPSRKYKRILSPLSEWYSSYTLANVLKQWEEYSTGNKISTSNQSSL